MRYYLAIDPGREKCGLAVVDELGGVVCRARCDTERLVEEAARIIDRYRPACCLLGNGTGSKKIEKNLGELLRKFDNCDIMTVDETATTEAARGLYWRANPPTGWRRLLPLSMLVPPEPIDDWAAVALARRWLQKNELG